MFSLACNKLFSVKYQNVKLWRADQGQDDAELAVNRRPMIFVHSYIGKFLSITTMGVGVGVVVEYYTVSQKSFRKKSKILVVNMQTYFYICVMYISTYINTFLDTHTFIHTQTDKHIERNVFLFLFSIVLLEKHEEFL